MEWKKWYIQVWSNTLVKYAGSLIGLGHDALAFAFWPFLVVRKDFKKNIHEELINHEKIHLRQQLEFLIVGAEILYILEYVYARYILKLPKKEAYYFISLEQEAHMNAENLNYLKERPYGKVLKYMKNKKKLSRGENGELIVEEYKKPMHS